MVSKLRIIFKRIVLHGNGTRNLSGSGDASTPVAALVHASSACIVHAHHLQTEQPNRARRVIQVVTMILFPIRDGESIGWVGTRIRVRGHIIGHARNNM
eukprot:COSAG05_NODE_280_length_12288_cov_4.797933_15_plen_99_part_00